MSRLHHLFRFARSLGLSGAKKTHPPVDEISFILGEKFSLTSVVEFYLRQIYSKSSHWNRKKVIEKSSSSLVDSLRSRDGGKVKKLYISNMIHKNNLFLFLFCISVHSIMIFLVFPVLRFQFFLLFFFQFSMKLVTSLARFTVSLKAKFTNKTK